MPLGLRRLFALLLVALAGLVLASCGGDDETTSQTTTASTTTATTGTSTATTGTTETEPTEEEGPTVVRVTVRAGVPAGGIVRQSVDKGDRVALVVTSDVADEVHLHGYDLSRDVVPGMRARIVFRGTIPGRFEVELENRGVQIAELTVEP